MIVELDLYSGRLNPTWMLTYAQTQELIQFISSLPLKQGEMVDHGILGYRGMILQGGEDFLFTIVGFGEVVQRLTDGLILHLRAHLRIEMLGRLTQIRFGFGQLLAIHIPDERVQLINQRLLVGQHLVCHHTITPRLLGVRDAYFNPKPTQSE